MNQIEIKRARNAADYQRAKLYNKALAHFLTRARARNLDMQDLLDGILAM